MTTQGEATSEGKLTLSNGVKKQTTLETVQVSMVLGKPIHPEDHVKIVHLQDSQIGGQRMARNYNRDLRKPLR